MRALTYTQPWAEVVVAGLKPIENRTRVLSREMIGQRHLVHAAVESHKSILAFPTVRELVGKIVPGYELPEARFLAYGAVVGSVSIAAMIPPRDEEKARWAVERGLLREEDLAWWYRDQWGYVLAGAVRFAEPIPCRGALGFWSVSREVEDRAVHEMMFT